MSTGIDTQAVMAYVDGELDAPARAAFEAALAGNAALRAAVERERRLRLALAQAYAPVLDEPVPAPLQAALAAWPAVDDVAAAPVVSSAPGVVDLAAARAARSTAAAAPRRWHGPEWGAMAACLVLGAALGMWLGAGGAPHGSSGVLLVRAASGGLLAQGVLEQRLTTGLAAEPQPGTGVALGLSFQARDGRYCRSFALQAEAAATAGLACRDAAGWAVQALAALPAANTTTAYRQAATALPPVLLQQLDALAAGPMLDADGERAARSRGWRR